MAYATGVVHASLLRLWILGQASGRGETASLGRRSMPTARQWGCTTSDPQRVRHSGERRCRLWTTSRYWNISLANRQEFPGGMSRSSALRKPDGTYQQSWAHNRGAAAAQKPAPDLPGPSFNALVPRDHLPALFAGLLGRRAGKLATGSSRRETAPLRHRRPNKIKNIMNHHHHAAPLRELADVKPDKLGFS